MRDADVRRLLLAELARWHADDPDTRIIDELDLCNGSARIDVAVLNGRITAFEIKSPRDRLDRLANQVTYYSRVADEAWLLTDSGHWAKADALIPEWWGVLLLTDTEDGAVALRVERPATPNPAVDPASVVRLMWREEAMTALAAAGQDTARLARSPRATLWAELVAALEPAQLADVVRETVKARGDWRRRPTRRPRRPVAAYEVVATL